ncbi:hypothetical protein HNE_1359 [Hyphomonas neptunium ATCC 15444]|uniref:Uncharacterized protein n=1 Tax=Hyphomonas neptunium (strain ATCC 15444) TaxID=228405 RepID=Q0C2G7_HYPNA|nr:hypothetical protein HNE_1359 [Hyphomonas neptunium ATCC 15444]
MHRLTLAGVEVADDPHDQRGGEKENYRDDDAFHIHFLLLQGGLVDGRLA